MQYGIHGSLAIQTLRLGLSTLVLTFTLLGCNGDKSSSYDRLCKIYEGYSSENPSDVLAVKIAERVQRELPEIAQSYGTIMQNPAQYRYEDLRNLARTNANQPDWRCEAIEKFHGAPPHSP